MQKTSSGPTNAVRGAWEQRDVPPSAARFAGGAMTLGGVAIPAAHLATALAVPGIGALIARSLQNSQANKRKATVRGAVKALAVPGAIVSGAAGGMLLGTGLPMLATGKSGLASAIGAGLGTIAGGIGGGYLANKALNKYVLDPAMPYEPEGQEKTSSDRFARFKHLVY